MRFIEPKFVDRVNELRKLKELAIHGSILPIYLYGPEGCGKTRLLKEFMKKVNGVAIYIDALERKDPERALIVSPFITELREFLRKALSGISGSLGVYLADRITFIVEEVAKKVSISNKPLTVIVDDVTRAIGLGQVEWYVKWLYELIKKLYERYSPRSILIIATTSEGKSLDLILRHRYAKVKLIWNLPRNGFNELINELNPSNNRIADKIWYFTGGNPRAVIEIAYSYGWNIDLWLKDLKKILIKFITIIRSENLVNELKLVIENPDMVYEEASKNMMKLYNILVEENLFIYKFTSTISGIDLVQDLELGIGKYYAWQIPAYKHLLRELL